MNKLTKDLKIVRRTSPLRIPDSYVKSLIRVLPHRWLLAMMLALGMAGSVSADLYLVETTEGPGFATPAEVVTVLENGILPLFDAVIKLESEKKIVAGGLPIGSRTFNLIVDAQSHDEVDRMLRELPGWGVFSWHITPLQTIQARASMEQEILKSLKSSN